VTGDEQDAFTRWRRLYLYLQRPGAVKAVKRRANRRDRLAARTRIRSGEDA
jgi:hypothetical protein